MIDLRETRREHLLDWVGLAGIVMAAGISYSQEVEAARLPVPGLEVWSLKGKLHKLDSYYGKPLLLHTYAPHCSPCKEGFPTLNQLSSSISVLGLFWGWGEDFNADKASWVEETKGYKMNFPSLLITRKGQFELEQFCKENIGKSTTVIPAFFILDDAGVCTHYQAGGLTYQNNSVKLRRAVSKITK